MENGNEGTLGWAAVGGAVLAFELISPETMSEAVDRALGRSPWLTRLAIGVVALHLLNLLPPQIDPLHQITNLRRFL